MKVKEAHTISSALKNIFHADPLVSRIVDAIVRNKGVALLVGGAVRDILLDLPVKDLDIEVYGLDTQQVESLLQSFGPVSVVGKAFGVFRLHGLDVDWSLPRTDSAGRKPDVVVNPLLEYEHAFRRRDLTINAMGIDLATGQLIDPFGGQEDLAKRILRAPDVALFVQDPLRFYRVMQFIGRFALYPDDELNGVCTTMDISTVSRERIEVEFSKLLLRSHQPSRGIRWLHTIGRLHEVLPELAATVGCRQDPRWHPEGDVFEHTMQALDAAAVLSYDNDHTKLIGMYAALCHDLAKPFTSQERDGKITSYGHAQQGVALAHRMLKRITHNHDIIATVGILVKHHMDPLVFIKGGAKSPAYKRLARALAPYATLAMLIRLALADRQGRNPEGHVPFRHSIPEVEEFERKALALNILHQPEEPLLFGHDVMDIVSPGPAMGALLKRAYQLQLDEGITSKEELKKRLVAGVGK